MPNRVHRSIILWQFVLLSYVLTLIIDARFLGSANFVSIKIAAFSLAVYLTYSLAYLLAMAIPVLLLNGLISWKKLDGVFGRPAWLRSAAVYAAAIVLMTLAQVFLFADGTIYDIYGFHFNGFVFNLLMTPGGVRSMGADTASMLTFGGLVAGIALLQAAMLWLVCRSVRWRTMCQRVFSRRMVKAIVATSILLAVAERLTYAVGDLRQDSAVMQSTVVFPFYQPCTIKQLARKLGIEVTRAPSYRVKVDDGALNYPLHPIQRREHRSWNIVWLAIESWRSDMLDPTIMPGTSAFADKAVNFRHHYSGGNGTRMGVFSMFYGLYGSYWFNFLNHERAPVIMNVLQQDGYQLSMYTSAAFTYPEFDRTVFANLPAEKLHSFDQGHGYERDRHNVTDMLRFIDQRDPDRPFMTFMFFESPHARYHFPPEAVIKEPYLKKLNYVTMDLARDMDLIKARYINACHSLDQTLTDLIAQLDRRQLLDSTIILMTGDHGEAFMEHGRWGHGSDFTEEQTRVPLVLWVPGQAPAVVTRMTSHMDIPVTLLTLLGVTNPPQDYSMGMDLLGDEVRSYSVLADWNNIEATGAQYKFIFPMTMAGMMQRRQATTKDDQPVDDPGKVLSMNKSVYIEIMRGMSRFSRRR
jgi:membrane-anchored protein YejM (alkaline phosphatase superfamily)